MEANTFATREEFWRLQEAFNDLSATQAQHTDRIMRLEKKGEDGGKSRSLWGPSSPFPTGLNSSHADSSLNPAAEAFRNFDNDPPSGMISSLTLDNNEEVRRAASRANSVRFDESANHYAPSRQSMDLPTRTGSGLGSHPLSERSLSHRSDGRGSSAGFGRTNSFGIESSRLLGSIHNSPRVSGNPPPGLFALGPCPAIMRCWLTETFTNDSLLYAALCTGAASSSVGLPLLQRLGLDGSVIEENGLRKVRLLVYLTEAKINLPSSRSSSPSPQVPTITTKFIVDDHPSQDRSIQITLGSDVLRSHNADILLSQDKVMLFDDDRNQLSIPLVRPEDDTAYRYLSTKARSRRNSLVSETVNSDTLGEQATPGVIGRPSRLSSITTPLSPTADPINASSSTAPGDVQKADNPPEILSRSSTEFQLRTGDESKSGTGSEKSATTPASKPSAGVWGNSWRSAAGTATTDNANGGQTASNYMRHTARPMKVLRPSGKSMANASRATSNPATPTTPAALDPNLPQNQQQSADEGERGQSNEARPAASKSNPIGSASAFGWLNPGQRKTTTSGGP